MLQSLTMMTENGCTNKKLIFVSFENYHFSLVQQTTLETSFLLSFSSMSKDASCSRYIDWMKVTNHIEAEAGASVSMSGWGISNAQNSTTIYTATFTPKNGTEFHREHFVDVTLTAALCGKGDDTATCTNVTMRHKSQSLCLTIEYPIPCSCDSLQKIATPELEKLTKHISEMFNHLRSLKLDKKE